MKYQRLFYVYPWILATAPILSMIASNGDAKLPAIGVGIALAIAWAVTGVAFIAGMSFLRQASRAAPFASIVSLLFLTYGRLLEAGQFGIFKNAFVILQILLLAGCGAALYYGSRYLARTRHDWQTLARTMTTVALVWCFFPVSKIVKTTWDHAKLAAALTSPGEPLKTSALAQEDEQHPDIYHIVLDGYARADVLKSLYEFDNSDFLNGLRNRGFYVADNATSNYPLTFLSLTSTLNMTYLDKYVDKLPKNSHWREPIYEHLRDHQVGRFLKQQGYRYVHFASNYDGTQVSELADVRYSYVDELLSSEFAQMFLASTPLVYFQPTVAGQHRYLLDHLHEVPKDPHPTFTFFHLVAPHNPYVFDAEGNITHRIPLRLQWTEKTGGWKARKAYVAQMSYINKRVTDLVDVILQQSKVPPIILIHSDHGSHSTYSFKKDQSNQSEETLRERMSVLYAVYAPERVQKRLSPTLSLVNTYPIILNEMFGAHYDLLPDHSYYAGYNRPYDFLDVTAKVTSSNIAAALP